MKILLLGQKGLLSSRIYDYFFKLDNFDIKSISLRDKETLERFVKNDISNIILDADLIINAIGLNNVECESSRDLADFFYDFLPTKLIKFSNKYKIRYFQFSSIHSVNYALKKNIIILPKDIEPKTTYGYYHNNLERLFLSHINEFKYASIIRLTNSIGPPLTLNYKKEHWISICNKINFQLFNKEKIIIKDPNLFKTFIPISLVLKNLEILSKSSNRKPVYQFVTDYKISLYNLYQIFSKYFVLYESQKSKLDSYVERKLFEYFIYDRVFNDLEYCNKESYFKEFISELKYTYHILKNIL